eukprot:gene12206-14289_t
MTTPSKPNTPVRKYNGRGRYASQPDDPTPDLSAVPVFAARDRRTPVKAKNEHVLRQIMEEKQRMEEARAKHALAAEQSPAKKKKPAASDPPFSRQMSTAAEPRKLPPPRDTREIVKDLLFESLSIPFDNKTVNEMYHKQQDKIDRERNVFDKNVKQKLAERLVAKRPARLSFAERLIQKEKQISTKDEQMTYDGNMMSPTITFDQTPGQPDPTSTSELIATETTLATDSDVVEPQPIIEVLESVPQTLDTPMESITKEAEEIPQETSIPEASVITETQKPSMEAESTEVKSTVEPETTAEASIITETPMEALLQAEPTTTQESESPKVKIQEVHPPRVEKSLYLTSSNDVSMMDDIDTVFTPTTKHLAQSLTEIRKIAEDIEEKLHTAHCGVTNDYKARSRSLAFNLKSNTHLRCQVLCSEISTSDLIVMNFEQLAPEVLTEQRKEIQEKSITNSLLPEEEIAIIKKTQTISGSTTSTDPSDHDIVLSVSTVEEHIMSDKEGSNTVVSYNQFSDTMNYGDDQGGYDDSSTWGESSPSPTTTTTSSEEVVKPSFRNITIIAKLISKTFTIKTNFIYSSGSTNFKNATDSPIADLIYFETQRSKEINLNYLTKIDASSTSRTRTTFILDNLALDTDQKIHSDLYNALANTTTSVCAKIAKPDGLTTGTPYFDEIYLFALTNEIRAKLESPNKNNGPLLPSRTAPLDLSSMPIVVVMVVRLDHNVKKPQLPKPSPKLRRSNSRSTDNITSSPNTVQTASSPTLSSSQGDSSTPLLRSPSLSVGMETNTQVATKDPLVIAAIITHLVVVVITMIVTIQVMKDPLVIAAIIIAQVTIIQQLMIVSAVTVIILVMKDLLVMEVIIIAQVTIVQQLMIEPSRLSQAYDPRLHTHTPPNRNDHHNSQPNEPSHHGERRASPPHKEAPITSAPTTPKTLPITSDASSSPSPFSASAGHPFPYPQPPPSQHRPQPYPTPAYPPVAATHHPIHLNNINIRHNIHNHITSTLRNIILNNIHTINTRHNTNNHTHQQHHNILEPLTHNNIVLHTIQQRNLIIHRQQQQHNLLLNTHPQRHTHLLHNIHPRRQQQHNHPRHHNILNKAITLQHNNNLTMDNTPPHLPMDNHLIQHHLLRTNTIIHLIPLKQLRLQLMDKPLLHHIHQHTVAHLPMDIMEMQQLNHHCSNLLQNHLLQPQLMVIHLRQPLLQLTDIQLFQPMVQLYQLMVILHLLPQLRDILLLQLTDIQLRQLKVILYLHHQLMAILYLHHQLMAILHLHHQLMDTLLL